MTEIKKPDDSTSKAIRQALMTSVALVPAWLMAPEAAAQTANAGPDQFIPDSNRQPGESVPLDGSGSFGSSGSGNITSFTWTNEQGDVIATTVQPIVNLPDGVNTITLTVGVGQGSSATDSDIVVVTVAAAVPLVANAGADRTIPDSDRISGESVQLDGTGSSAGASGVGSIGSFTWTNEQGDVIATTAQPTVRLPDGTNTLTLTVGAGEGSSATASDMVVITVVPPQAAPTPVANAGPDRSISDTDSVSGESVQLDGTSSSAGSSGSGSITSFTWTNEQGTVIATTAQPTVRLPDGTNTLTLTVGTGEGSSTTASDVVVITVLGAQVAQTLQGLEVLTPNQRSTAIALNDLCQRLNGLAADSGRGALTPEQLDLIGDGVDPGRCAGAIPGGVVSQSAIDELGAQQFSVIRLVAVEFAQTQYQSVMDRLLALRSGQRGVALADVKLQFNGNEVPVAQLAAGIRHLLGGGASSDNADAGGLLDSRMGFWFRGSYGDGGKDRSLADAGFNSDQVGMTGGFDYRFRPDFIGGVSLGYGEADIAFSPGNQGGFDTQAYSISAYSTAYLGNVYFDGVVNYVDTSYDTTRRLFYTESTGNIIDRNARGSVDGQTFSAALSTGYDFVLGAFTISPTVGYYYLDGDLDGFTERGAGGLSLQFDQRDFRSSTGNVGLRATYAWKTPVGVFVPHVRATYIREFEDGVDTFGVRFTNDPGDTGSAPIIVTSDIVDQSYFRLAAGLSAQLKYDISGYFEYQRLQSYSFVDFHDFTFGVRWQKGF